jgi:Mce-associated membrane protein
MAGHADTANRTLNGSHLNADLTPADDASEAVVATEVSDYPESADEVTDGGSRSRRRFTKPRLFVVICLTAVVASAGVAGWMGFRVQSADEAQTLRNELVQGASQMAINLTTIDYTRAEADVRRILDSTSGAFHDDFDKRSKPFIDVITRVKSKSQGTVTGAGIESQAGAEAQVLVAVSVKTTNDGAPEQESKSWRMRIKVQKSGDAVKAVDVQFVP